MTPDLCSAVATAFTVVLVDPSIAARNSWLS
jgi:hypothetical protein